MKDSDDINLAVAREKIKADTEAYLAQEGSNGIEVIENASTEEIMAELAAKYRPLLSKTQTFKFDGNKRSKKK